MIHLCSDFYIFLYYFYYFVKYLLFCIVKVEILTKSSGYG